MTTEQKSRWNKQYYRRKKEIGWQTYSFQLPACVGKQVHQLKCELMDKYKKARTKKGN